MNPIQSAKKSEKASQSLDLHLCILWIVSNLERQLGNLLSHVFTSCRQRAVVFFHDIFPKTKAVLANVLWPIDLSDVEAEQSLIFGGEHFVQSYHIISVKSPFVNCEILQGGKSFRDFLVNFEHSVSKKKNAKISLMRSETHKFPLSELSVQAYIGFLPVKLAKTSIM